MAEDIFKPSGSIPGNRPDSGNANIKTVPVFGVVKDNVDPIRSGRLRVYISDFNIGDPNNSDTWITVRYMSPFYGRTNATSNNTGYGTYKNNPHSYGMWNSPPDIGTTVICLFINGSINYGFWIGCVPDPEALYMVPAIGAVSAIVGNTDAQGENYAGATQLPVTNINVNSPNIADTPNFIDTNKPIHSYAAHVFAQQGLIRDTIRGPITSSAQRESPSRVGWGVSTPGRPIYTGGFDDKTITNQVNSTDYSKLNIIGRRSGHSIVMDDGDLGGNDQLVRIRTSLGHQILLSDSGQCLHIIHANGQSWIELGKEGTIDMYSTNSVNVRTQGDLNLHADNNININAAKDLNIQAENIKINSEQNISFRAGANFSGYSIGSYSIKTDGSMGMFSGGEAAYSSSAVLFFNGSRINLNTGSPSISPMDVKSIPVIAHTDTLYDSKKGFLAAPGKLLSIVSRAPAHAPWANAGQGVDVKVKLNATDNAPSEPTAAAIATNAATNGASQIAPSVAQMSTAPVVGAVSESVNKATTAALTSASAAQAATGVAKNAVTTGETIVENSGVKTVAIGNFAFTPNQMETAGFLKPGSATRINSQIQNNVSIEDAFSPTFFTGLMGVNTLSDFKSNLQAQATCQKSLMQNAQTVLQSTGAITGKETPEQISGMVLSGATQGVDKTIDFVKNITSTTQSNAQDLLNNVSSKASAIASTINLGNITSQISSKITSGLSSISNSVTTLSKSSGISGATQAVQNVSIAAFNAIANSLKSFKANVPISLKDKPTESPNETATGAGNLPGGERAIASVVNTTTGTGIVPGLENIKNEITNKSTAVMNNISQNINSIKNNVTNIANQITTGTDTNMLNQGKITLGNLAQTSITGLPNDLASQLSATISSLNSGGPLSIKLPTVATGTTDRSAIDGQASISFGDPSIPVPDYSGKGNPIDMLLEKRKQLLQQQEQAFMQLQSSTANHIQAVTELSKITNSLPQGSTLIETAKNTVISTEKAIADANQNIKSITISLENFDNKALASLKTDMEKTQLKQLINKLS